MPGTWPIFHASLVAIQDGYPRRSLQSLDGWRHVRSDDFALLWNSIVDDLNHGLGELFDEKDELDESGNHDLVDLEVPPIPAYPRDVTFRPWADTLPVIVWKLWYLADGSGQSDMVAQNKVVPPRDFFECAAILDDLGENAGRLAFIDLVDRHHAGQMDYVRGIVHAGSDAIAPWELGSPEGERVRDEWSLLQRYWTIRYDVLLSAGRIDDAVAGLRLIAELEPVVSSRWDWDEDLRERLNRVSFLVRPEGLLSELLKKVEALAHSTALTSRTQTDLITRIAGVSESIEARLRSFEDLLLDTVIRLTNLTDRLSDDSYFQARDQLYKGWELTHGAREQEAADVAARELTGEAAWKRLQPDSRKDLLCYVSLKREWRPEYLRMALLALWCTLERELREALLRSGANPSDLKGSTLDNIVSQASSSEFGRLRDVAAKLPPSEVRIRNTAAHGRALSQSDLDNSDQLLLNHAGKHGLIGLLASCSPDSSN